MQTRSILFLSILSGVVSGVGSALLAAPQRAVADTEPSEGPIPAAAPDAPADPGQLEGLEQLAQRVEALERAAQRAPRTALAPRPEPTATTGSADPVAAAPGALDPASAAGAAEFDLMLDRVLAYGADPADLAEQERFWRNARETDLLDRKLAALEQAVAEDPRDAAARLDLAQAYVAKLLTVPAGPERGVWGVRAEAQWTAVVDADPQNWEANFALGENWSYYPAFLGKTDAAIDQLERARALQESGAQTASQSETYALLGRLYATAGETDRAREVLNAGVAAHPGDEALAAALAAL